MKPNALAAALFLLGACNQGEASVAPPIPITGTVAVETSLPGISVPDDFMGISVEWWIVPSLLGDGHGGASPKSVALLGAFEAEGHHVAVRVGGNSEDESWWNPDGNAKPKGVSFDLGASHVATLGSLQKALGNKFILGLNLVLDDGENASRLVNAALAAIPHDAFLGFELGNEPDRYGVTGARPPSYDWKAYLADVGAFHDSVAENVDTPIPFAGPALASRTDLPELLAAMPMEKGDVSLITTHVYAYSACDKSSVLLPADLLTDRATTSIASVFAPIAAAAHTNGYTHRMAEMNSASCGGVSGVSDVYASALWGADIALELASAGLDGINFHMPGIYAAWDGTVHPLYYGMRFFSLATAKKGRFLATKVAAPGRVRAWSTLGDDGAVRVGLLNEDPSMGQSIRLQIPGKNGAASAIRLKADAIDAKTGVTLGEQTWDGSTDGDPRGDLVLETLARDDQGVVVTLPALEGVVITVLP